VCDNPRGCQVGCHKGKLFCVGRARFHLAIAKLGKTQLSTAERKLLAPNDRDGGKNLENWNIQNPLFIYEMNEVRTYYANMLFYWYTSILYNVSIIINPVLYRKYQTNDTILWLSKFSI